MKAAGSLVAVFTAAALLTSLLVAACGGPTETATANVSGVVRAASGAVIEGASVKIGTVTATTGADGQFELQNLPVGNATITTSAPDFDTRSQNVSLTAG